MDLPERIEAALSRAIEAGQGSGAGQGGASGQGAARAAAAGDLPAPGKLAQALAYAVHPGGARIRPRLLLSVATACGEDLPALSDAAAAAVELIHCASLVHDDMPCFDNADLRRGKPSLHRAFGEPIALLAGDSLIVMGFDVLARAAPHAPDRAAALVLELARRTGMPHGICAGQGWESEADIDLSAYHRAKTGALFIAATRMGAIAAGRDGAPWDRLGDRLGEAFQVADDLKDAVEDSASIGKPAGQDSALGRPSAVAAFGVDGAVARFRAIMQDAADAIPDCPGRDGLAALVGGLTRRLVPQAALSRA